MSATADRRAAVVAHDLSAGYGRGAAIEGVDFVAEPGQTVAVLGPNGGGKTTLFRALLSQIEPMSGSLAVNGRAALLAQTDRTRLDFPVSALDVALMGQLARGAWWRPPGRADRAAARSALARVGLDDVARTRFGELSGGQRQRVLLARAIVEDAAVLLLDEPLAGIDAASEARILDLLDELSAEGRTLLVSTHDAEGARRFDRVLCLNRQQVAYGEPATVLTRAVLERTYGAEIMVLEGGGDGPRAITVHHHDH